MRYRRIYHPKNADQVLVSLRREIRAAQLKVTLDTTLGRESSLKVKLLSEMELPPIVRQFRGGGGGGVQPNAVARRAPDARAGRRPTVPADEDHCQLTVSDAEVPTVAEPGTVEETGPDAAMEPSTTESANRPVPVATASSQPVVIEPAQEEHSGHVTLYLAKDLNHWLGEHHDSTGVSYPGIVLNAISWAVAEDRLGQIFAPDGSPIPANDIFRRAPALPRAARVSVEQKTRPVRFRKDHMQVIISLARTWTADNRNAFFVGVLTAYRDQQVGRSA